MTTIWKFPIEHDGDQIRIPKTHRFLTVQMQGEVPCVWAVVDTNSEITEVRINIFGTGHRLIAGRYIGTYQPAEGLVFHVFAEAV